MEETKIIYHIDDEETPYLIKVPVHPDNVTLGDFVNALNRPSYKFFFKSMDDDFGVVKEEIVDESTKLPCVNGRVVSWLVSADSSDCQSLHESTDKVPPLPGERLSLPVVDPRRMMNRHMMDSDTDSVASSSLQGPVHSNGHSLGFPGRRMPFHTANAPSTLLSSDIDTTSYFDSDDESRFTSATETTASRFERARRRRKRQHRLQPMSRASSFSSITDSTMSLNIVNVTLNMDTVNFLGISIVGQSNKGGDGGIYVGSIMKGGAVAQDGRIEPGDMILEVNGASFEDMSNDDAVRTLREAVQTPGPITLVVAKCWDPNPKGYFNVPRQEPCRPLDPSAWVAHTNAMRNDLGSSGLSAATSTASSVTSSLPESDRYAGVGVPPMSLTVNSDMATIIKAMAQPNSGLEIRDRMWLKITIPNAFIGSDLVEWLYSRVEGFADRRDARKYACNMLKNNYIRHTVNKLSFSEQCYYVLGEIGNITGYMSSLTLEDIDSVSEVDRDTIPPLPPVPWATNNQYHNPYGPTPYLPPPPPPNAYIPPKPYNYVNDTASYMSIPQQVSSSMQSSAMVRGCPSVVPSIAPSMAPSTNHPSCAPIIHQAVKQVKKLWESSNSAPEKASAPSSDCVKTSKNFLPPPSYSTLNQLATSPLDCSHSSSSNGSSTSGSNKSQRRARGESNGADGGEKRMPPSDDLPPPPTEFDAASADINASRQSFRMAMSNP